MKKIFYNRDKAYHVVRKISIESCNPKRYGINRDDNEAYMKVLQVWRNEHYCDHVLKQGNDFLLCRTIKDVEIIE